MKKLLLLSALFIFACSSDSEGNPCIYEPTLETNEVTDITETSATLNGVISIVSENCDVPNNTEQGFVYSTEIQPTLEDTQVNVNGTNISTTLRCLTPNTTYYVRAFLTNNLGDFYGDEISFSTANFTVDCDGFSYESINYGTQKWTVENACHTTYRDGTPIPQTDNIDTLQDFTTGAWCYYDNGINNWVLYNWYAVMGIHDNDENTPNKEFAPLGWHVPSLFEWRELEEYLIINGFNYDENTEPIQPDKLAKSLASTWGWLPENNPLYAGPAGSPSNDQCSNNSSGFNAFPVTISFSVNFWSTTELMDSAYTFFLDAYMEDTRDGNLLGKQRGAAVRLVKD